MPDQQFYIDIGNEPEHDWQEEPAYPDHDYQEEPAIGNWSDFSTGGYPDYGGGYAPEPDYSTYEPPQYGAPSGSGLWQPEPSRTQPTTGFGVSELANSGVGWDDWYNNLWMNQPLTNYPSELAEEVAPSMGYYGGATKAIGDFASGMTSPLNLATAGAGLVGRVPGMIAALPKIANIGRGVEAALSLPVATHGAYQMARPGATPGQRILGGVEALGGGLGLDTRVHPYGLGAPRPPAPAASQIPTPNAEPFVPRGQLSFPDPSGQPGPYLGAVPPYAPSPQPLPAPPIRIPKTVISDTKRIKVPTPGIIAYWERLGYKKGKWLSMEEGGGLMMYKESTVWTDAPAPPAPPPVQAPPSVQQAPPPTQAVGQAVPPVTDFPKPLPGESLMKFQRRTQLPIDEARVFYEAAMRQAAPPPVPVQQTQPQLPIQPEPVAPPTPVQAPPPARQLPERFTPRPGETFNQFQTRNRLRTSAARELWDAATKPVPELPAAWQGLTGVEAEIPTTGVGDMIADTRRARALARTRDELGRFLKEESGEWEVGRSTRHLVELFRGGLKVADNPRSARFILPDGTPLTHANSPGWVPTHGSTVMKLGTKIDKVLQAGIIRFTDYEGSAHVGAPITRQQAEYLADSKMMAGRTSPLHVDVDVRTKGDRHIEAIQFDGRDMNPDTIYNKINVVFKRFMTEESGEWRVGVTTEEALKILDKFRKGLKSTKYVARTKFVLPDGLPLTHNEGIHEYAAQKVGTNLKDAMKSGVMRVSDFGGVEVAAPITQKQAEFIADYQLMRGSTAPIYVDVHPPNDFKSLSFDEGTRADTIRSQVNSLFKEFITGEKGAVALDDVTLAAEASKNFLRNTMGWGRGNAARRTPIIEGEMGTTILDEALGMAKNSMTIGDYSGLARQTYPTIYSKHFWTGIWPMIKSGWNEDAFRALDSKHRSLEAFKRPKDQAGNIGKSLADRSGIRLHEWGEDLSKRGEQVASNWIENGAFLGPQMVKGYVNPVRAGYNQTLGRLARGSNRAFITIRNHVAANMFQDMVDNARDMAILAEDTGRTKFSPWKSGQGFLPQKVTPEQAFDMNPYTNDVLARDLADAVRTLVGDPPLRTHVLPHPGVELNLEKAADILSKVFFAPRLAMRQVRLMNPWTYVMAPPAARKEYMKSMLAMTAAWGTAMKGLSMAGVDIEWDMTSSDFGKGRIGNTRFGPSTEFLPYLVLGARLWEGGYTSAATEPGGKGEWHEFGKGFGAGTAEELMQGLAVNKLEPVVKFAFDVANASEHKPFHVIDRSIGLFVAMSAQDLVGIAKESPGLAAMLSLPIIAGFGTQTYSRHEEKGKIWPSERDWVIKGGGIKHRLKEMGFPVEVRQ